MDILGLLKRIEWGNEDYECPICGHLKSEHDHGNGCDMKSAIYALESGRLVVVDLDFVKQAVAEITGVSLDNLLNKDQKQVFIEAIIRGQLANPPREKR